MASSEFSRGEFAQILRRADALEVLAEASPVVLVHPDAGTPEGVDRSVDSATITGSVGAPVVVVAVSNETGGLDHPPEWCDAQVGPAGAQEAAEMIRRHPSAAVALAWLLRMGERLDTESALVAESSTYSMLQASEDHREWLARRNPPEGRRNQSTHRVGIERDSEQLTVTLERGEAHNAFDSHMRDGLCEALEVALWDPSITAVHLRGTGPSFCSGGDLNEFGTAADPAAAHRIRVTRSPARLLAALSQRCHVFIHGHTYGSGIELAAFAGRVVAHRDTSIALPELGLGLIPGAGGTASIPRRIGRHRTMELALRQEPIDATTALRWRLVDEIHGTDETDETA